LVLAAESILLQRENTSVRACAAGGKARNMLSALTACFFIARASGETDFDFGASK
jgi:hypothetical protein